MQSYGVPWHGVCGFLPYSWLTEAMGMATLMSEVGLGLTMVKKNEQICYYKQSVRTVQSQVGHSRTECLNI